MLDSIKNATSVKWKMQHIWSIKQTLNYVQNVVLVNWLQDHKLVKLIIRKLIEYHLKIQHRIHLSKWMITPIIVVKQVRKWRLSFDNHLETSKCNNSWVKFKVIKIHFWNCTNLLNWTRKLILVNSTNNANINLNSTMKKLNQQ